MFVNLHETTIVVSMRHIFFLQEITGNNRLRTHMEKESRLGLKFSLIKDYIPLVEECYLEYQNDTKIGATISMYETYGTWNK